MVMDIATFMQADVLEVKSGRIAYFEKGKGGGTLLARRAAQRIALASRH